MDAMRCHRQTCSDYNAAVNKQKHNWNLNRHNLAGKAADAFLKQHCLVITYNPNDNTQAVMQFLKWRKSLADSLQIPEERGYTFALCNLAAPSLSHSKELQLFGACGSCMSKGQNLMAVIMPQFSYKRNQNYPAQRMVEDLYITRGLGLDAKWALVFNKKSDTRDNRCLVYDGRLIIPMEVKDADYVFKNVPLLQGRTEPAEMLPGNKMKTIEDVTACNYGSLKGAQKHAQLGQDAMEKILQAATQEICMSDRCFMMFWEINMLFGDMFDAYLEMRQQ